MRSGRGQGLQALRQVAPRAAAPGVAAALAFLLVAAVDLAQVVHQRVGKAEYGLCEAATSQ